MALHEHSHPTTALQPPTTAVGSGPTAFGEMPNFRAMMRIPIDLKVVVGSTTLSFVQLTNLVAGQLITLDRRIGDKVDVVANGQVVARGDIVVIDAEQSRFGVVISELVESLAP